SDTGTGMDAETKRHVFEPFFTTKEEGKGTGLGLAVVYGVIQSHRGFIELDSTPGRGTTFRLFFPSCAPPTESPRRAHSSGEVSGGTERILVVEDEELLRELLASILECKGYRVLTAKD